MSCGNEKKEQSNEADTIAAEKAQLTNALPTGGKEYFFCYKSEDKPGLEISVCFDDATGKAKYVKYKGQAETIPLAFVTEEMEGDSTVAHPSINTIYNEQYKGVITGQYILTHSGIWDYVKYTRQKDGKVFNFTVDLDASHVNDSTFRTVPCF